MAKIGWALLNAAQWIGILIVTAGIGATGIVVHAFTRNQERVCSYSRRLWSPCLMHIGGVDLTVEHEVDLNWSEPHIYLSNHQSVVDIPACFIAVPHPLRFIAKHVLRRIPVLGYYMKITGMIFVNRSNRRLALKSMRMAAERVRSGASIIAYPEGTRSTTGEVLPFKKGVFMVAIESGVPIVPCATEGGRAIFPRGFKIRPGKMRVITGRPIPTEGLQNRDRDALIRQVRDEVIRLHRKIGGIGGPSEPYVADNSNLRGGASTG